jgi:hypothetical protein
VLELCSDVIGVCVTTVSKLAASAQRCGAAQLAPVMTLMGQACVGCSHLCLHGLISACLHNNRCCKAAAHASVVSNMHA